jgi:NADP-dependent 3-hydroxy acid dehydrogenase YdfG
LVGVVKNLRAFIPVFSKNKGHFINISSIAGLVNLPLGAFIMQKHAVESFLNVWPMRFQYKRSNGAVGNTPSNFQKM